MFQQSHCCIIWYVSDNCGVVIPVVGVNLSSTAFPNNFMPDIRYIEDMRQEAVARALDPHTTVAQVARDIGCSTDTMHRWPREHRQQGAPTSRQQNFAPTHQQGAARPTVSKMPCSQLSKAVPLAIARKNSHTNAPSAAPQSPASFIPVNIIDSQGHSVEIVTPHGTIIRLTDVSPQYIAELFWGSGIMLTIPTDTRISLCIPPVDMRKLFNGLIGIVRNQLGDDPLAGHLFVFLNKSNTLIKILFWDGDGFAIWYKRLEIGTFRFPSCASDATAIDTTRSGLSMILEGIDLSQLPKRKRFSRKTS